MNKYLNLPIKIYLLFFVIIITSLNSLFGQYKELGNCINEQIVNSSNINYDLDKTNFDIFDSIQKFENYLINTKLLKDKDSESYRNLIDKKIEKKQTFKIVNEFRFLFELNDESLYWLSMYNNCPSIIGRMNKEWSEELWPEKKVYDQIVGRMEVDSEILHEASKVVKYENKISRLIFCNLIYLNWFQQYKDEFWEQKNK